MNAQLLANRGDSTVNCSDVEEMIPLVAEGLIDPDTDHAIFEHLNDCACCQDALYTHDMITLNLSQGHEIKPATQHNTVIHFHISRSLASAAALLLLICGAIAGSLAFQEPQAPIEQALAVQEPETQILEVLPPQHGSDVPLIIIRHNDKTMMIRQDQIDNGTDSQHVDASMPVNIRY